MNLSEKEKLNDIINELYDGIAQYESLNEDWFQTCLDNRDYDLLIGALIPLATMRRANEKLQSLWMEAKS